MKRKSPNEFVCLFSSIILKFSSIILKFFARFLSIVLNFKRFFWRQRPANIATTTKNLFSVGNFQFLLTVFFFQHSEFNLLSLLISMVFLNFLIYSCLKTLETTIKLHYLKKSGAHLIENNLLLLETPKDECCAGTL